MLTCWKKPCGYFLLSVIIYLSGMALDVLDEINFMRQFGVLQLDTSLKNIGFIFICIGLLRLIHDKRKIINTLISKTISNNQSLQEQLIFGANHDPLTQIGNRRALFAQYRQLSRTHNKLLYFDLDNFKQANDTHGHQMGDRVLKLFAKSMFVEFDHASCFRIGGDEFLALTDQSYDKRQLQTLKNCLSQSIRKYDVGVSIGFYTNTHNETIDACLHKADRAMYQDKQSS